MKNLDKQLELYKQNPAMGEMVGGWGQSRKEKQETGLVNSLSHTTAPPSPSPWGLAIYNTGLSPPPSKLALKN